MGTRFSVECRLTVNIERYSSTFHIILYYILKEFTDNKLKNDLYLPIGITQLLFLT